MGLTAEQKKEIIQKNGGRKENILGMLLDFQDASPEGYVDEETRAYVAEELGISEARVYELVCYYAMLKDKPQAKHVLKVCNSSPCHFSKADKVAKVLEDKLGVKAGVPTSDGSFAWHFIPCVGACDIGPVIKVKGQLFGNLDEGKISDLLEGLRSGSMQL